MPKAVWNGTTLAESPQTVVVEGNHYFPPDSLQRSFFRESVFSESQALPPPFHGNSGTTSRGNHPIARRMPT